MSKSSKNHVVRTAGLLERYHVTRVALGLDTCVLVSARYVSTADSSSKLTPSILYPALRKLIETEGALCVRIEYSPSPFRKPKFIRLPTINLDKAVEFKATSGSLQEELEHQTSYGFDFRSTEKPLWRLTVLPDNTVIFAYHHAIGDGMSGRAFHISLLQALQTMPLSDTKETDALVEVPIQINMTPPVEKCTKVTLSVKSLLGVLSGSRPSGDTPWTALPVTASIPTTKRFRNYVRLISITPSEATSLLALSKQHKSTLTGTLFALSVHSLSQVLAQGANPKYNSVLVSIPMSLRPLTGIPENRMCDQASAHTILAHLPPPSTPLPNDAFWAEATKASDTLRTQRQNSLKIIANLRFAPLVGGFTGYFKSQLGKPRGSGLSLVNVGAWPRSPSPQDSLKPNWEVAEAAFTQEDTVTGDPVKICVMGGGDGSLTIAVNWGESSAESALMEAFIGKLEENARCLAALKA
ncbi:hypothetical protein OE88DRAFT_1658512 [Heliocybe sulcata]|uniref:Alcohol acetyltransferase n=1 Tax=Heliocybe sulcata TaxID=5364 RepID=A0A5C3NE83_9AGAM|nr:hypothetical protein OE88DRAFT_1658512 [Heliocybe sulcata]